MQELCAKTITDIFALVGMISQKVLFFPIDFSSKVWISSDIFPDPLQTTEGVSLSHYYTVLLSDAQYQSSQYSTIESIEETL